MTRLEQLEEMRRLRAELKTERRLLTELTQMLYLRRYARPSAPWASRLVAKIKSCHRTQLARARRRRRASGR